VIRVGQPEIVDIGGCLALGETWGLDGVRRRGTPGALFKGCNRRNHLSTLRHGNAYCANVYSHPGTLESGQRMQRPRPRANLVAE